MDVPYFAQTKSTDWCYLYTPSMVLQYYGHNVYPWDLAKEFETTAHQAFTVSGPWSFDFLKKYIESKYDQRVRHSYLKNIWGLVDFNERVKKQIDLNIPPIFFYSNHAIVIVGYSVENENKYVYVHDPSSKLYPSSGFYDSDNMFIKVPWGKIVEDVFFSIQPPVYFDIASDFDKKNNPMPPDASYWIDNIYISHFINEGSTPLAESFIVLDKGININNRPFTFTSPIRCINWLEDDYVDPKTKVIYSENDGTIRIKLAGMNPNKILTYSNVVARITKNDKIVKTEPIGTANSMPIGSKGDANIIDFPRILIPIEDIGDGPCTIDLLDGSNNHVIAQIETRIISNRDSWTIAHSPVELELTDPLGIRINKDSIYNGDMYYIKEYIDNYSNSDDMIVIPKLVNGCYHIFVIPKDNAILTDVYTLEFYSGGKTIILAKNIPISSIPDKPSTIEVTNNGILLPITVNKTAFPLLAAPGASINFIINITNTGTMPLNHVQVIDHLPDSLIYISDNKSGEVSGRAIAWNNLPPLNKGESIIIKLVTRIDPDASGNITNLVEAIGTRATEKQEEVSNSGYSTVRVVDVKKPKIRQNVERTKIGNQVAMATGNGRAINNIKVVSN